MKIQCSCPVCKKNNFIPIDEQTQKLIKNKENANTVIQISQGQVCEHDFLAYIDKNYAQRDAVYVDYSLELDSESQLKQIPEKTEFPFKIHLIKWNLTPECLENVLSCIITGKKILFLDLESHLTTQYEEFFKEILKDSFNDYTIKFLDRDEFKKKKKKFRDYLVIRRNTVERRGGISFKFKLLKAFSFHFWKEYDDISSLIQLKNLLFRLFLYSKSINEQILKTKSSFYHILRNIEEDKSNQITKIHPQYEEALYEIIKRYHLNDMLDESDMKLGFFLRNTK